MKISFSATSFPHLDFKTAADLAKRCGYDGVELPAARDAASSSSALLTAGSKIREIFDSANIEISALNVGLDLPELADRIAFAQQLGCAILKIGPGSIFARTDTASPAIIDRLLGLGDIAAAAGVSLLIENQPMTGSAVRLWHLLDRLNHPSIGCVWNTLAAAIAGDSPAVAVPTLNSRIRSVELEDAKGNPLARCELGDGQLPLQKTANRLRGIGFSGWLRIGFGEAVTAEPEQRLHAARAVLKQWQIVAAPIAR